MSAIQNPPGPGSPSSSQPAQDHRNIHRKAQQQKQSQNKKTGGGGKAPGGHQTPTKLRGLEKDPPAVRLSKTMSWLLRHGAKSEGLPMRPDGYVKVRDLLENGRIKSLQLDFSALQEVVKTDSKQRFDLKEDLGEWWIKANQGHSMQQVKLELKPVLSLEDIPTRVAVHGTTQKAWELIAQNGLSKMTRNHIHLAQGVPGDGVISGMRKTSQVLIYIDVQKALNAGLKFFLSDNGVVLSEGINGIILPEFFSSVQDVHGKEIPGWKAVIKLPSSS